MTVKNAVFAVLALCGLAALVAWLALVPPPADEPLPPGLVAEPRFEEARAAAELAARKRALLASYAWLDRDKGVARIPIERAFDIAIARAAKAAKEREDEAKEDAAPAAGGVKEKGGGEKESGANEKSGAKEDGK